MDDASKSMVESYKKLIEDSATRTAIVNVSRPYRHWKFMKGQHFH